jgi:hypothetical protein
MTMYRIVDFRGVPLSSWTDDRQPLDANIAQRPDWAAKQTVVSDQPTLRFYPSSPEAWLKARLSEAEAISSLMEESDEEEFEKAADTADQMDKLNETLPNDAVPVGLIDANIEAD